VHVGLETKRQQATEGRASDGREGDVGHGLAHHSDDPLSSWKLLALGAHRMSNTGNPAHSMVTSMPPWSAKHAAVSWCHAPVRITMPHLLGSCKNDEGAWPR
jgi:hypothetical protein